MSRFSHHRSTVLLRIWVLALFAFSALVQPAMAMLGELHEVEHDPGHSHAVVGQPIASADLVNTPSLDGDGAGTLHLFAHYAHCCGQSAAPMSASAIVQLATSSESRQDHPPRRPPVVRLVEPDRPPIA